MNNKKGLSPIIASVLLIVIVMVLAALIFVWARGFVTEKIMKNNEVIENSCAQVNIKAEAYGGKVRISNEGRIPIYGLEIVKKSLEGSSSSGPLPFDSTVIGGESGEMDLPSSLKAGDSATIIPVLLGESGTSRKSYTCSDPSYDLEIGA